MIYFIQAGENGPIKIGYTDNEIEHRLAQLQTGCPYELICLWKMDGDTSDEAEFHELFQHEHIRGEWFHPARSIFSFIQSMGNTRRVDCLNSLDRVSITERPWALTMVVNGNEFKIDIDRRRRVLAVYDGRRYGDREGMGYEIHRWEKETNG